MPGRHQTSTLCLLPSRPFQFQFDAASAVDTLLIGAIAIVHVAVEDQHAQHQSFREQFLGRDYETIERQEPESFPETSTPEGGLNSRHSALGQTCRIRGISVMLPKYANPAAHPVTQDAVQHDMYFLELHCVAALRRNPGCRHQQLPSAVFSIRTSPMYPRCCA
jgi:hypothetical protein